MKFKLLKTKTKRTGTILLNSVLILLVAMMVVSYSNAYFSEQIDDYRRLDELYKHQINNYFNKSNKIECWESRNP